MLDNTTAIAYINKMGGRTEHCGYGASIETSGFMQPLYGTDLEWKLNPIVFEKVTLILGKPSIALFAYRINHKIKPYVSWGPDPETIFFKLEIIIYGFPPFSLINRMLKKIKDDQTKGIVIVPLW
jgi:hypothetical protein